VEGSQNDTYRASAAMEGRICFSTHENRIASGLAPDPPPGNRRGSELSASGLCRYVIYLGERLAPIVRISMAQLM
jgi:hypothetical protein